MRINQRVLFPEPVTRNQEGLWMHSEYAKAFGYDDRIALNHPIFTGLDVHHMDFESDWDWDETAHSEAFKQWEPQPPGGHDWFLICLGSDEDGYFATWVHPEQTCRVCGCTWNRACPGGCCWVEDDLCSACVGKEGDADEHHAG